MSITRVLFVDDDDDIRTICKLALEWAGWHVDLARSGAEALERVDPEAHDLVLLDVMMPGMDGRTTFGKLRELEAVRELPVVFMTAKVQPGEVQSYMDLGAAGVIAKPFDPMSLAAQISQIVDRRP